MLGVLASAATCAALASTASASAPIALYLSEPYAFDILGHSCGGIQERSYATGFALNGYPTGVVHLQTRCGGSGRGGGGHSTTYTASAGVVWTWFGETRSAVTLTAPPEEEATFTATDAHGDRLYNSGAHAYLEVGEPPLQPPAAPTAISAGVALVENGSAELLQMTVAWTPSGETAALITTSTVTATPVGSGAPVLSASASSYSSSVHLGPVEPDTTYRVTVTNTDSEGTSEPGVPVEVRSPNSDGEVEKARKEVETCTGNSGSIRLSPGLTERAAFQTVSVKGTLSGCEGPLGPESASYAAVLKTSEALSCTALSTPAQMSNPSKSFTATWNEEGRSKGSLSMPVSEAAFTGFAGSLSGGPLETATTLEATSLLESFTGGPTCGQRSGKRAAEPVRRGLFSTSEVEFG